MSQTATAVKPKIYHLLDNGKSSVEYYQRINANQRVKVENRKNDRPYLQITFTDENGVNRTIRFKLNANTPFQDEQIEKLKIPANEKFTNAEMDSLWFKNGVLVTANKLAQFFLDIHPQNEKFTGDCPDIKEKLFREYNPAAKTDNDVKAFRNRAALANKILAMDLEEAQSTLIRLNGSYYKAPEELNDCITGLVDILDAADDDQVQLMLQGGVSLEDEITILISKATQRGVLSFEEPGMENFVVKKSGTRIIPLKEIPGTLPPNDRRRLFSEFLASNDGALHLEDLRKSVAATEEKKVVVSEAIEPAPIQGVAKENVGLSTEKKGKGK